MNTTIRHGQAIFLTVAALAFCGCQSTRPGRGGLTRSRQPDPEVVKKQQQAAVLQQERKAAAEESNRLKGDVRDLWEECGELRRQLQQVQAQAGAGTQAQASIRDLSERLGALEGRMTQLEQARKADKQEIVNVLSERFAKLLQQQQAATARPAPRPARNSSQYGVEHKVNPGETLSAIAAAYGVSKKALIEANNLSNADILSIGQVLFIPE